MLAGGGLGCSSPYGVVWGIDNKGQIEKGRFVVVVAVADAVVIVVVSVSEEEEEIEKRGWWWI